VDWMYLAQDRDHRLVLVNMIISLQVPQDTRGFLTS
jgi:hypothetical protein